MIVLGFGAAVFIHSWLLFSIQPMASKMLVPYFGGAPAVWTTSILYFQVLLLVGYLYSHWLTTRLQPRAQVAVHGAFILGALFFLPLPLALEDIPSFGGPIASVVRVLTGLLALPLCVVCAGSPLLQKWFAGVGHRRSADPYFLYAIGALGSILAVATYPFLLENHFTLQKQFHFWRLAYAVAALLTGACALAVWRRAPALRPVLSATEAAPWGAWLRWAIYAFVPATLMLSITSYFTEEVFSVPLFWLCPLGLYLVTYFLAFEPRFARLVRACEKAAPASVVLLAAALLPPLRNSLTITEAILVQLSCFTILSLFCHGKLAASRPRVEWLTQFYLASSMGGIAGSLLNAVVVPLLFPSSLKFPFGLIAAACLLPASRPASRGVTAREFLRPLGVGLLTALLMWGVHSLPAGWGTSRTGMGLTLSLSLLAFLVPYLIIECVLRTPLQYRAGLSLYLGVLVCAAVLERPVLYSTRSFFGVLEVLENSGSHWLYNGSFLHGMQSTDPARRDDPPNYLSKQSPMAKIMDSLPRAARVGVVGLGTGGMAAYADAADHFRFFEINPAVVPIANNPAYFTFLTDARLRGANVEIVLGDARLKLRQEPSVAFDFLMIDAFNSELIPVHLITREALELYLDKLAPGGTLAFNITNRYMNLEPVISNLAQSLALEGRIELGDCAGPAIGSAKWVFLKRAGEGKLPDDPLTNRLKPLSTNAEAGIWTDTYAPLFRVFQWRKPS